MGQVVALGENRGKSSDLGTFRGRDLGSFLGNGFGKHEILIGPFNAEKGFPTSRFTGKVSDALTPDETSIFTRLCGGVRTADGVEIPVASRAHEDTGLCVLKESSE